MVNKSLNSNTWTQSQKLQNDLCSFPRQTIQYHSHPSLCPNQECWRSWSWTVLWRPTDLLELTRKKDVLLIIGDWNAKVGSQETPGVTGKFGLGIWNKAGQRLIEFYQENAQVIETPSSNNTREDSTHGHHQMVNIEIRLIIFFAANDGEALYSQQKQDWELTVAQIMNSLLPNSDLNWRK